MCMQFGRPIVVSAPAGETAMSIAAKAEPKGMSDAQVVEAYLTASMIPDPEAAAAYMKPGTIITFTGGREFDHPRGPTRLHGRRHPLGQKQQDRLGRCPRAERTRGARIGTAHA